MIVIGFILGFAFALGLIQLCYLINVNHAKKGKKLVSEGKGLLEQQRQIQADLLNIESVMRGVNVGNYTNNKLNGNG